MSFLSFPRFISIIFSFFNAIKLFFELFFFLLETSYTKVTSMIDSMWLFSLPVSFQIWDIDEDGYISREELYRAVGASLFENDIKVTEDQLFELIDATFEAGAFLFLFFFLLFRFSLVLFFELDFFFSFLFSPLPLPILSSFLPLCAVDQDRDGRIGMQDYAKMVKSNPRFERLLLRRPFLRVNVSSRSIISPFLSLPPCLLYYYSLLNFMTVKRGMAGPIKGKWLE